VSAWRENNDGALADRNVRAPFFKKIFRPLRGFFFLDDLTSIFHRSAPHSRPTPLAPPAPNGLLRTPRLLFA
jgi:hypothetical protein